MKGTRQRKSVARVVAATGLLSILGISAGASLARADVSTYLVGGVGFLSVAGEADAAVQRDPGLNLYGGLRRRLTERITIGVSGEYGYANLNAREFFQERDIFLNEPDRHVTGGKLTVVGGSLDGLYEYPVGQGTIVYGTLGAGFYSWSVETIFVNAEELGIEDQVASQIIFEDESGPGGHVGIGARFPLGESAGLWAEFAVEFLSGAAGGSMQLVPLRAGVSFP